MLRNSLFIMLLVAPFFVQAGWGDDAPLTEQEKAFNICVDNFRKRGMEDFDAYAKCEEFVREAKAPPSLVGETEEEKVFRLCVADLKSQGVDEMDAYARCLDLHSGESIDSDLLNRVITGSEFNVEWLQPATAVGGSVALGVVISSLFKSASRVANPAFMFIPPSLFEEYMGMGRESYTLPSHNTIMPDDVKSFLRLNKSEQVQVLDNNKEMYLYLKELQDEIRRQDHLRNYNLTHLSA